MKLWQYLSGSHFPRIARGHRAEDCHCAGREKTKVSKEAKYSKEGTYIDGHFQSQAVAQRAHEEGHR